MTEAPDRNAFARAEMAAHADRAARYASMVVDAADMGDDVVAGHAVRRLIVECRMAAEAFKLIAGDAP